MKKGRVTLLVFSGRPDPAWVLSRVTETALDHYWHTLEETAGVPEPIVSGLGYRGLMVETENDTWFIFRGLVSRQVSAGKTVRKDASREIERTLLLSAPAQWQELAQEILRTEWDKK